MCLLYVHFIFFLYTLFLKSEKISKEKVENFQKEGMNCQCTRILIILVSGIARHDFWGGEL